MFALKSLKYSNRTVTANIKTQSFAANLITIIGISICIGENLLVSDQSVNFCIGGSLVVMMTQVSEFH